jgi:outer membrane protein
MFRDHWGVEVVAATPFSHDIEVEGLDETLNLGETKHLPPTVLLQWFPMDSTSAIQPYIGLGVNYTVFFDEKISGAAKDFFETDDIEMTLDSSIGLAAEAGIDFTFGARNQWMFNLAVWWMDIDTEAEVDIQGLKVTADVELDPLAYMAGFGYRF